MDDQQLKHLLELLGIISLIIACSILVGIIGYWVLLVIVYVFMCVLCPCCAPTWDDYMHQAKVRR